MPNTFDICDKLNSKIYNTRINRLKIYEHYLNFEKELTNYLLDKLILFNLDAKFITIEEDIPTIISYINELLPDKYDKKCFFYNFTLYLVQYISIINKDNYDWLLNISDDEYYKALYVFEYVKNNLQSYDKNHTSVKIYQ